MSTVEHQVTRRETVELDRLPALGSLYRRAALGMLPGAGRSSPDTLPGTELVLRGIEVDRDHLAAYDRVCGFRLTGLLPATYPHVVAFPLALRLMSAPGFPFPAVGLVHVGNRVEVLRPVDAGERLDLRVHAADLRPHPRGRQLDVVSTVSAAGTVVCRDTATYLRKERAGHDGERRGERAGHPVPPPATAVWQVTARTAAHYAAVSGDRNPIHTSTLAARLFGFPRRIAHGMWTFARCLAALEGRLPDRYTVDASFKLPVLLPGSVAFSASPGPVHPAGPPGWAVALHDARSGKPHLTATVTA